MNFPVKYFHFESGEDMRRNVAIVPSRKDFRKMMSSSVLGFGVDVAVHIQTPAELHNSKVRNFRRRQI